MRRLTTALAVLATCAGLAACGDDSLSTEDYRAEAKRVCEDSQKATRAVERPQRATTESIADYLERLLAANERTIDEFGELDPPDELQPAHAEILKVNERAAQKVRDIIAQLEQDEDPAQVLQAATAPLRELNTQANAAAEKLGVPACVQDDASAEE